MSLVFSCCRALSVVGVATWVEDRPKTLQHQLHILYKVFAERNDYHPEFDVFQMEYGDSWVESEWRSLRLVPASPDECFFEVP